MILRSALIYTVNTAAAGDVKAPVFFKAIQIKKSTEERDLEMKLMLEHRE